MELENNAPRSGDVGSGPLLPHPAVFIGGIQVFIFCRQMILGASPTHRFVVGLDGVTGMQAHP